ncbi:hypothetical protein ACFS6H_07845 [Terrimonas rubra]|uniref:Outer membrane protein beta-barrel domain-containing protein n=1 Tax=Terrimonas rubra TaxID=1035890 RepID=A0ABW6A2W0_9BACT
MLANSLSLVRLYLPVLCLLLTPLALPAQDTLILKPTPKKPQGDTLIVKLARVYFAKEISYVPYENFHLTEKDKKILADGKMIKRPDQAELDALSVEKILYDEHQKHTIQFIYKNYNKIKRLQELRTVKNIVSVGLSYTSLSTFDLTIDVLGSTKTPSQYVIFLQPTYERLVYRGMLGLRIAPTISLNRPAFGAIIGHRIYFFKQRPFSFALGTDIAFVNSTLYRQFSVSSNKQMRKENKNELYISPLAVQFSYTFKNNYYIGLDFSFGGRYIFQNKPFIFDGEPYKYDDLPFMSQLRLNIGKKF